MGVGAKTSGTHGRRILIAGLSSAWGGRLAQQLERDPSVAAIIGIDTRDPRHELDRTEFVRVGVEPSLLRRIIRAAAIDTVVDTRLIADPLLAPLDRAHEVNVVGTRNLLSSCGGRDTPVRKLIFSSAAQIYGSAADDPAFFTESVRLERAAGTAIERDVTAAEAAVAEFAAENPSAIVTVLRIVEALGGETGAAHLMLLTLPVIPAILGFDPRLQFVHEDDVVGSLEHVIRHDLPGTYNVAADGVLALSEIASLLGKPLVPLLPPWGSAFAAAQLRRLGLRVPVEMIRLLRHGRGLDNRRLKAAGFTYRYTTREAVQKLRAQQRLRPLLRSGGESYRYEREVEEFLRFSHSVQSVARQAAGRAVHPSSEAPSAGGKTGARTTALHDLSATELIEIIGSLEASDLEHLRAYEAAHGARRSVLEALDRQLQRKQETGRGA